jgi:formylglycine-generating enzyme required for sulfatase activity
MAGNVAEWVQDVYRPIIDNKQMILIISENQYTKNKIGADGKIEIVTAANMKFDTLSNGRNCREDSQAKLLRFLLMKRRI